MAAFPAAFVRPPPVQEGTVVRVFAPAGALDDAALQPGRAHLQAAGCVVEQPAAVTARCNYFAGDVVSRAQALYEAVTTPAPAGSPGTVAWAARGGYGSAQLVEQGLTEAMLDAIDRALAARPRWLVGYSDLTVLALHLWARAGVLVLHGPMVFDVMAFGAAARAETWALLRGTAAATQTFAGRVRYGGGGGDDGESDSDSMLARGRLLGGNIQVLASLVGAEDRRGRLLLPSFAGCILLLEEVGDAAYRIHRSLCALLRSPNLQGLAGIAIGQLTSAADYGAGTYDVYDVLEELLAPLGIPVLTDLPVGHETATARPIVLGAEAEIHGCGELRVFVPGIEWGGIRVDIQERL